MKMTDHVNQCIKNISDGLIEGLSLFTRTSRVAVIYAMGPKDPVRVYDPQSLLSGHEPKLGELYGCPENRFPEHPSSRKTDMRSTLLPLPNLQLAGLISFGGCSVSVAHQMWFTEHHPDLCSVIPIERWLEQAAWQLSRDVAAEKHFDGTSGHILRDYAIHAIHDCILDERNMIMGWDTRLRVYPILDAILKVSRTPEEGNWPRGRLVFMEPSEIETEKLMVRFPEYERPMLQNSKHVRKLLQAVENSNRKLISDGTTIIGIGSEKNTPSSIHACYNGEHGFLYLGETPLCSFSDGAFHGSSRQAKLVEIEELLLDSCATPDMAGEMFKIISELVHYAESRKRGGTIVVDLNTPTLKIPGHQVIPPIDLKQREQIEFAKSLTKIDGAVHMGSDLKLHSFACLLDGTTIMGENLSRGARFNSALRFSANHKNVIIIVISADRSVSTLQEGIELTAQCVWKPVSGSSHPHPLLAQVIEG